MTDHPKVKVKEQLTAEGLELALELNAALGLSNLEDGTEITAFPLDPSGLTRQQLYIAS